jgi:hypothetical protein
MVPRKVSYENYMGEVYILHLQRKFPTGPAQHYAGFAPYRYGKSTLAKRLEEHASGTGSKMLAAAVRYNIGWELALVIPTNQAIETRIKMMHHTSRICPICLAERGFRGRKIIGWITSMLVGMSLYLETGDLWEEVSAKVSQWVMNSTNIPW